MYLSVLEPILTRVEKTSPFSLVSFSVRDIRSLTVLTNGQAWCNSAFWSCANGWPDPVNTLISCRLPAAALEQRTSSGMDQMKEQIIPSSPWMTCSSDPESVSASLAFIKARLAMFSTGNRVAHVCVSLQVILYLHNSLKITAHQP